VLGFRQSLRLSRTVDFYVTAAQLPMVLTDIAAASATGTPRRWRWFAALVDYLVVHDIGDN
jgi:hypothetical protein